MGLILSIAGILGVGGLGVAAWLFGPAALLGFGRSALGFLARIPWQVYAIAALAALIAFLFISRAHALDRAHADEVQLATICTATRAAADNPKLNCRDVPAQISELGTAVTNLKGGLAHQNAAVDALAVKTAAQQKQAQDALGRASQRVAAANASSARLEASARSAPGKSASAGACEPSPTLKDQWR